MIIFFYKSQSEKLKKTNENFFFKSLWKKIKSLIFSAVMLYEQITISKERPRLVSHYDFKSTVSKTYTLSEK